jgi:hypothetical protein
MSDNTIPLNQAAASLADCRVELEKYDSAIAAVKAKETEITQLEADHENVTADVTVPFKVRTKAHAENSSALAIHRSDLISLQTAADAQQRKVVAAGRVAARRTTNVRDFILLQRQRNVSAQLAKEFDWAQVPAIGPDELARYHTTVAEIQALPAGDTFLTYADFNPATAVDALRTLEVHFEQELRPLAEKEPDLDLSPLNPKPPAAEAKAKTPELVAA